MRCPSRNYVDRRAILVGSAASLAMAAMPGTGTRGARAATSLKVQLNWLKNVESAPHFAAEAKGLFRENGLDVALRGGGPQIDPVGVLASGTVDIAMVSNPLAVLAARSRGVPIAVIGCGFAKSPLGLAARKDRQIKLPVDLAKSKIGYQQVNRNLLQAILSANNVGIESIATTVVTADPTMLIEGRIDLMTVSVLNVPLAIKQRGVEPETWLAYDLGVPMQGLIVTCLADTLKKKRSEIEKFMGALGKGLAYNIQNPDEVAAYVSKQIEGLELEHQKAYNRAQLSLCTSALTRERGVFWIDETTWKRANEVAVETAIIPKPVELDALLDYSVLKASALPRV